MTTFPADRPEEIRKALAVLELPPKATATEVRQSYRFLRDLYRGESIATLPISSEMSQEERKKILGEVEEAYEILTRFFDSERSKAGGKQGDLTVDMQQLLSSTGEITGEVLKTVRKMRGYRLPEIAAETRIPAEHLAGIEAEAFTDLPPVVYTTPRFSGSTPNRRQVISCACLHCGKRKNSGRLHEGDSAWHSGGRTSRRTGSPAVGGG